jgi:aliphatic nitrilase
VSLFVDPTGATVGEWRQDGEGLVDAALDLNRCIEPKQFHDVVGYYNRFDVFDPTVTRERPRPATWIDRDPGTPVMLSDDPAA